MKKKFIDEANFINFIEKKRQENEKEYQLPRMLFSVTVTEEIFEGMKVVIFNKNKKTKKKILYIHGGGYIGRPLPVHWRFLNTIAKQTGLEIIVPLYPLAPQYTYNYAYEKMLNLYQDLISKYEEVTLMGDSAGGGFCLGLSEYLNELNINLPRQLILLSPWLDISMSNPQCRKYEDLDPFFTIDGMKEVGKLWAGEDELRNYKLSPIFGDISGLCPINIFVGTNEILYPDNLILYKKAIEKGVKINLHIKEDMEHVYVLYPIKEAKEAQEKIISLLK